MRKSPFDPYSHRRTVPGGKDWIHEIKHDGYGLIIQRDGRRVRLFTRNGHDWSDRFPLMTEAALRNRNSSFVIDGEAVLLGVDGRSDFNGLHSRKHDDEVQFYAFDILVSDGEDLRKLPLSMGKTSLARLLARRVDGIFLSDFEQGEIGSDLFRHACLLGLEGLVSKHREAPTAPADHHTGSRSRTGRIPPLAGCRISSRREPFYQPGRVGHFELADPVYAPPPGGAQNGERDCSARARGLGATETRQQGLERLEDRRRCTTRSSRDHNARRWRYSRAWWRCRRLQRLAHQRPVQLKPTDRYKLLEVMQILPAVETGARR